jgi:hypothetical protein
MVSEPFIFLSSDRLVNVRCCRVKDTPYFCVKDFIRRTAKRRMGPLDALQYWVSISLALQHEVDIMRSYMYRFPGPYELPTVCVNANGLLLLLHHMDELHKLVDPAYRAEANKRLQDVLNGDGEQYIEDYDDGEIDSQTKEAGEGGFDQPADSCFWYSPTVEIDGKDVTAAEALRLATDQGQKLQSRVTVLESEAAMLKRTNGRALEIQKNRIEELEQDIDARRTRIDSFSLTALISDLGLQISAKRIKPLCRRVASVFKKQFPERRLKTRHRVVIFNPDERDSVELILRQVHLRMELEADEREHWVNRTAEGPKPVSRPVQVDQAV